MNIPDISIVPVAAAAVIYIALGSVWYMPQVFGDRWKKLKKVTDKDISSVSTAMGTMIFLAFIMSIILSFVIYWAGALNFSEGAAVGFFVGVLVISTGWMNVVFGNESGMDTRRQLFFIDYGYPFIAFILMGGVLAML